MTKVNVYKIDPKNHRAFEESLEGKLDLITQNSDIDGFYFKYYEFVPNGENTKSVGWKWILREFNREEIRINNQPRAILIIQFDDEMFAISFGSSYFYIDRYADKDFPFDIAKRVKCTEIKTTTVVSPNVRRNKSINSFVNYSDLEFDSGESFAKLKAKVEIGELKGDISIGEIFEFGNSIKVDIKKPDLEIVSKLIGLFKEILKLEAIYPIPLFNKVTDVQLIDELEKKLKENCENNKERIGISEVDIIGVNEIFNNQDATYLLMLDNGNEQLEEITYLELEKIAEQKRFKLSDKLLDLKIQVIKEDGTTYTERVKKLIDYVDDEKRCVLNKGVWYHFNDDYQNYLSASLSEIDVFYDKKYDFSEEVHNEYLEGKYNEINKNGEYKNLSKEEVIKKIKKKFYAEYTFNSLRKEDGFELYDRQNVKVINSNVELMDLYKDETMFAVKIGSASSDLCYAIDQSLASLKVYKHRLAKDKDLIPIKNIAIWLILERKTELELIDCIKPDINQLDMLMLKNRLDHWKKEVRLNGYNPIININYRK
ncbi:uncharacterized protein (TIGR04141 family) [Solibacillus kalamii]|uniref:Sporadically distributed protein, TIGR04141 family n=1 Tax=Solibacillus kalamii TaxID=1748298 RepID=A0ABX3ZFX8_9BACL|nr:DUF6119 family protein [Solibacillus kalamii]MBM7666098.1 uncharacterized protein (TIGR04141 family) [Solibacillus kalamii]OUZ38621.1 hypothetical protein CBM15_12665 [Solibacillus kalamii]